MKNQSNETAILVNNLYLKDGTAILLVSYGDVHVPEGAADLFGFMPKKESDVVTEIVESETDDVSVPERLDVTVTDESVYQRAAFGQVFTEIVKLLSIGFTLVLCVVSLVMRGRLARSWTAVLPIV